MPLKDPVKRKEYEKQRNQLTDRREARKRYSLKRLHTLSGRRYQWENQGIKSDDWYDVYDRFYSTTRCELCDVKLEGKGKYKKCVDHHHLSGEVRNIVCCRCNCERNKLDNIQMKLMLEMYRYFILK